MSSFILTSVLFWIGFNPSPEGVADLTLTCHGGTDPTRQATAIPTTSPPAQLLTQLLGQPCHPALSSAHLLHPPVRPSACPSGILLLPACSPASPIRLVCRPVSSIRQPRPCTDLRGCPAAVATRLRSPSVPLVQGDIPPRPSVRGDDRRGRPPFPVSPPRRHTPSTVLARRRSLLPSRGRGHGGWAPLPLLSVMFFRTTQFGKTASHYRGKTFIGQARARICPSALGKTV